MNNFTTDERIEQFSNLMNPYVSEEFKEWLIESGFFTASASSQPRLPFTTTGLIPGRCSIIALQ